MNIKEILCICLALILVLGIVALPYDFNLSINNNTSTNKGEDEADKPSTDNNGDGNGDNNNGGDSSLITTSRHEYPDFCSECDSSNISSSCEDYGAIGEDYYSVTCNSCGSNLGFYSISHEYSNKDGVCTALGCGEECDHRFTFEAINYYISNDSRFAMFDPYSLSPGDSAVYNGVCTICQKTIN